MHPFHIFVSIANLAAAAAFFLLMCLPNGEHVGLASFAVGGGYFFNAIAVAVSIVMLISLVWFAYKGKGRTFIRRQWLGVFNGAFVVGL